MGSTVARRTPREKKNQSPSGQNRFSHYHSVSVSSVFSPFGAVFLFLGISCVYIANKKRPNERINYRVLGVIMLIGQLSLFGSHKKVAKTKEARNKKQFDCSRQFYPTRRKTNLKTHKRNEFASGRMSAKNNAEKYIVSNDLMALTSAVFAFLSHSGSSRRSCRPPLVLRLVFGTFAPSFPPAPQTPEQKAASTVSPSIKCSHYVSSECVRKQLMKEPFGRWKSGDK